MHRKVVHQEDLKQHFAHVQDHKNYDGADEVQLEETEVAVGLSFLFDISIILPHLLHLPATSLEHFQQYPNL